MKKIICLFVFIVSSISFSETVIIVPQTMLRISYGDSSLELNLTYYNDANFFRVKYIPSQLCPNAPQTALQVRYDGNPNWYNTAVEQGVFRHGGFRIAAIKIFFRQLRYTSIDCEVLVTGIL